MTMHFAKGLTTTGTKKGKVKWASAEHKKQAEQLDKDWNNIKKKHVSVTGTVKQLADTAKRAAALKAKPYSPSKVMRRGDDIARIPSLNSTWDPCLKMPDKVYSGDKIIGIAQMAKSNAVPIFNSDHITDIARMRR